MKQVTSIALLFATLLFFACTSDDTGNENKQPGESIELDSVFTVVKWRNDSNTYVIQGKNYIVCNTQDLSKVDAQFNDVLFHFVFDEQKRLTDVRSDLMTMHVDYNDESSTTTVYGNAYQHAFVLEENTDSTDEEDEKSARTRSNTSDFVKDWFIGQVKTPIVQRAIHKMVGVERNINDAPSDFFRDHAMRQTLNGLVGLADAMHDFQKYEDMSALEIVNEFEQKYPDMGGAEYLFAPLLESHTIKINNSHVDEYMRSVLAYVKDVQNRNEEREADRYAKLHCPLILFGLETELQSVDQTSCDIYLDGALKAMGGVEEQDFEFGVCVCTNPQSIKASEYHAAGSFTVGGDISEIQPTVGYSIKATDLKPQTTYYYRAYCRSRSDNSYICEDPWKEFATDGELKAKNDAALSTVSSYYFPDDMFSFEFRVTASRPQIDNLESWGVFFCHSEDGKSHYEFCTADDVTSGSMNQLLWDKIYRPSYYRPDVNKYEVVVPVDVGIWAKVAGQPYRLRTKTLNAQKLVYDQAPSITFKTYEQSGDTYNATTSVEDDNGNWHTATCVGLIWYPYEVTVNVTGAFFMEDVDYAINQYEYTKKYPGGRLIYSDSRDYYLYDGENSLTINQLTCPSGFYSVEGKKYSATVASENWEWFRIKVGGEWIYSTNALHYWHEKKPGLEVISDYKAQRDIYDSNPNYSAAAQR
jgi:hypothetical protein